MIPSQLRQLGILLRLLQQLFIKKDMMYFYQQIKFWEYLKYKPGIISNLFKHANIRHITEIFEKLVILDTCQEEHDERQYIEERQNLINRILKYMRGQSHSNAIITNICESLIEVYKRALMSLETMIVLREILLTIEKPQFFMSLAIQTQNSSIFNLLNIQYEFYNKMSQLEDKHYEIDFSVLYKPILDESVKALTQQDLFRASFKTTYGDTIKPLGDSKLSLIQLIIQLIQKQNLAVIIEKGQIFQEIINLVIYNQTNNQLHILFERLVVSILDSKNDHLHDLFFEDTNFLKFLIENNGFEERKKKHGYQGILTKITNYINSPNVLQQYQIVQKAIASVQNEWLQYLEELKVVNSIEQSWLLGVNPRFREQINVDSYSPPLQFPEPLGSDQYQSTNNQNQQANENQQESQEDTFNNNEKDETDQQADKFDSEEAQLEKQVPVEFQQVKEENIESQEEQQPQKYEQQIVDSPVYVQSVQNGEQKKENHGQIFWFQDEPKQLVQEEQEIVQQEEQQNEKITEQKQEQQNLLQEQPNSEEQQNLLQEEPKKEESQNLHHEQPKQEDQQNLQEYANSEEQQQKLQEQPKQEEQLQPQVKQELQTEDHANSEQLEQNKQSQDEV